MVTHKGTQTLETPRLTLRRATLEDAKPMFRNWASDPEVTKFLTWPPHESMEVTQRLLAGWIAEYEKDDYYHWMIILKDLDEPIGSIIARGYDERIESIEIGYCIGRQWWHKGIMTEALNVVVEFLFTQVCLNRIESRHDPNNPHSGDVMQKCGMRYEGTGRQADKNNQGICDAAYYAILRSDWEQMQR